MKTTTLAFGIVAAVVSSVVAQTGKPTPPKPAPAESQNPLLAQNNDRGPDASSTALVFKNIATWPDG